MSLVRSACLHPRRQDPADLDLPNRAALVPPADTDDHELGSYSLLRIDAVLDDGVDPISRPGVADPGVGIDDGVDPARTGEAARVGELALVGGGALLAARRDTRDDVAR